MTWTNYPKAGPGLYQVRVAYDREEVVHYGVAVVADNSTGQLEGTVYALNGRFLYTGGGVFGPPAGFTEPRIQYWHKKIGKPQSR